jgi:hypothetical protein
MVGADRWLHRQDIGSAGRWPATQCRPSTQTAQFGQLRLQLGHGRFQLGHALGQARVGRIAAAAAAGVLRRQRRAIHFTAQQVHVAVFALAAGTRQHHQQRALQALDGVAGFVGVGEAVQALAARDQLAQRLRPAQQQQRQQHGLLPGQVQRGLQAVLVAVGARGEVLAGQAQRLQLAQRVLHAAGVDVHHRLAGGLLVGGRLGGVDRQRIGVRGGRLLLHQAAQQAGLHGVEQGDVGGLDGIGHGGLRKGNGSTAKHSRPGPPLPVKCAGISDCR